MFQGGVTKLLDNVLKTLTATSVMGLSSTMLLGVVGTLIMWIGAHKIMARHADRRRILHLTRCSSAS